MMEIKNAPALDMQEREFVVCRNYRAKRMAFSFGGFSESPRFRLLPVSPGRRDSESSNFENVKG